jgi:hypothetical protein
MDTMSPAASDAPPEFEGTIDAAHPGFEQQSTVYAHDDLGEAEGKKVPQPTIRPIEE